MKIHQHNAGHMSKIAAMPIYGKNIFKIFFPGTTWLILVKLFMKHQRPKPFIFCSNYDSGLNLTFLWQGQILQLRQKWENVTMMDSFEIFAPCDFG